MSLPQCFPGGPDSGSHGIHRGNGGEVQVRMPFSASTLPTSDALHQLGLLICADVDRTAGDIWQFLGLTEL